MNSEKSDKEAKLKLSKDFLEEVDKFDEVVKVTNLVSGNQQGIATSGRGVRAVQIFTKQTLTANSLMSLLPDKSTFAYLWDGGAIAGLSRNIIECFLAIHYFGIENVSEVEAELRFFIYQRHRNVETYKIQKGYNPTDPDIKVFENGIKEEMKRIQSHTFYQSLTKDQQNRIINGVEMYKTKADFASQISHCKGLTTDFRYLSNLAHPVGVSIWRIDNESGRGLGSVTDMAHCLRAVRLARKYQAASTAAIAEFFPERFGGRFLPILTKLKELIDEGFA